MWWILQVVGCVAVCGFQVVNRTYGVGTFSWLVYALGSASVTYFAFAKSYAIAPNFVLPWMVGQTALNVLGLTVGFLLFKDHLTPQQWIGIILSIVGGYLIIK
jgi:drug/metabolite transporter (DMT)-like permease